MQWNRIGPLQKGGTGHSDFLRLPFCREGAGLGHPEALFSLPLGLWSCGRYRDFGVGA